MELGAPWRPIPDRWSLDRHTLRVQVPATIDFVRASTRRHGSGLWATMVCTHRVDHRHIFAGLAAQILDFDVLDLIADRLVQRIVGWNRWEAEHVWTNTLGAWPTIDGDMRLSGVDLLALGPAAATNTAFAWWRKNLGENADEWKKWTRDMERVPRRAIIAAAEEPMSGDAMAQLQANIAAARGR